MILFPTLVFWISNSKSAFGQIWAEKIEAVCFALKVAHDTLTLLKFIFFEIQTPKFIIGQVKVNIAFLFISIETLLLFLDIQPDSALYFEITFILLLHFTSGSKSTKYLDFLYFYFIVGI